MELTNIPLMKALNLAQPADFEGGPRFDDTLKAEWHIISTAHPDLIGDIMEYEGMQLPPSGKGIALLNHDPAWTGGLPLGAVLAYKVVKGADGVDRLWQRTQYLENLPDNIGMMTYEARKLKAFTDSSIQFFGHEGGMLPVEESDIGKPRWDWKGCRYQKWSLLEAGPVLMGMNWNTGNMKSSRDLLKKTLTSALNGDYVKIIPEQRLRLIAGNDQPIKIIN